MQQVELLVYISETIPTKNGCFVVICPSKTTRKHTKKNIKSFYCRPQTGITTKSHLSVLGIHAGKKPTCLTKNSPLASLPSWNLDPKSLDWIACRPPPKPRELFTPLGRNCFVVAMEQHSPLLTCTCPFPAPSYFVDDA